MIKAILFDLDNTLIDFMLMKRKSCEAAMDAMINSGLKISKNKGMKILYDLYGEKGIEYKNIFQEFLRKTIRRIDYKILARGVVAYRKAQVAYVKPYPGTVKTLVRLKEKGLKLGIVSDAPSFKGWVRLVEMGIEDLFDVVVTLEDTGKEKPSRIPFMEAVKKLGIKPENILFVGDRPGRDIKGAKATGMRTVFAKYGDLEGIKKSGADYEIEKITDLLKIV
ncbi:MAG: TIGR02253 family HAD-type hydrolase [Candidatus Aenigmarchaeota archaeon]|nr:TIGR02253 family HAD-type hydrolase [Candidatus Aenigmarchaeota archaeon]